MFITPDSIRLCSWRPISPSYRGPQRTPTKCIRWGEEETQAASTCSASSLRRAVSDDKSTANFRNKIKNFLIDFVRFFYIAYTPNCIFPADYSMSVQ